MKKVIHWLLHLWMSETTIRKAIQNSINVVAVKCLEQVTPALGLKYLDDFGFTTLAHGTEADKDANGNVYIVSYGNGLFIYNRKEDELQHFSTADKNSLFHSNFLLSVFIDPTTAGLGDSARALTYKKPADF